MHTKEFMLGTGVLAAGVGVHSVLPHDEFHLVGHVLAINIPTLGVVHALSCLEGKGKLHDKILPKLNRS